MTPLHEFEQAIRSQWSLHEWLAFNDSIHRESELYSKPIQRRVIRGWTRRGWTRQDTRALAYNELVRRSTLDNLPAANRRIWSRVEMGFRVLPRLRFEVVHNASLRAIEYCNSRPQFRVISSIVFDLTVIHKAWIGWLSGANSGFDMEEYRDLWNEYLGMLSLVVGLSDTVPKPEWITIEGPDLKQSSRSTFYRNAKDGVDARILPDKTKQIRRDKATKYISSTAMKRLNLE